MTATIPSLPGVHVKHVLVPLDGSELALQAMPTARVLAQRLGADLHTVTVADGDADRERAQALAAATLGVPIGVGNAYVVTEGDPADVIVRRRDTLGSCLVCLATHGRGRLGGAVVGSVARSVLQRSDGPVIALGPSATTLMTHARSGVKRVLLGAAAASIVRASVAPCLVTSVRL